MLREVRFEDIENGKLEGSNLIIDVRTPDEFQTETIPGAINIPIFTNEERAIVGTTYVQESIDKAKQLGVEFVSSKLPEIYRQVAELDKKYDNLIFFCARGGFRSKTVVVLFKSLGINAIRLEGGYKGYRKYVNDNLPRLVDEVSFIVLYGNTGCGKTEVLKQLKTLGQDVLDLEGCANHRGSLLGGVGLGQPNTQKMFESLVYETLSKRKSDIIFTEGESKRIGRVVMPDYLFTKVKSGQNVEIKASTETRIKNLLKDYVNETDDELIEAIGFLKPHIGEANILRYTEMIKNYDYAPVVEELMTKYYDPKYEFRNREYIASFENRNAEETAREIVESIINSNKL